METLATRFKALGDPTRLRILALLRAGELCVCDLTAALGLPQSTVSRHLALLRAAGWVTGRRGGAWMYYRLAAAPGEPGAGLGPQVAALLADAPQAARDQAALAAHLVTKTAKSCA